MHQSSHHATTCGGEGENEKLQCFCFRFFFLSSWSGNGIVVEISGCSAGQLGPMCFHSWKKNKNKNTASDGDVRVLFHREDQGNDKPQSPPPPPSHPPASYTIYIYLQYLTPGLRGTTRNEFSVWSHVNKGTKRQVKLGMERLLFPQWRSDEVFFFFLNPWGVKQQNSRSFFVTVAVSLAWSSAATQRWTLERDIHKNMPILCKYPVKTDKRELDMVNVMPFSAVHIPSSQPNRTRRAHHMMSRFKTNSIF